MSSLQPLHAVVSRRWLMAVLVVLLVAGCGDAPRNKHYTIGVVNYVPVLEEVLAGFKNRMSELGYVEGKNVTYLYSGVLPHQSDAIDREIAGLAGKKVDLIFALGTMPALAAKRQTDIPVVFAPVVRPVEEGVVKSVSRHESNLTGIQNGDTIAKTLEWLQRIVPPGSPVHVVHHPKDRVALTSIKTLQAAAPALQTKLIVHAVTDRSEAMETVRALPKNAALFVVASPTLDPIGKLVQSATEHGIPVGTSNSAYFASGALLVYGPDYPSMGRQAARLADQIFKGTKPADLPIETAEHQLKIDLRTARKLGLTVPDSLLNQAHSVVR